MTNFAPLNNYSEVKVIKYYYFSFLCEIIKMEIPGRAKKLKIALAHSKANYRSFD